jgi:DNA-binding NarL/FixJ family response regulator
MNPFPSRPLFIVIDHAEPLIAAGVAHWLSQESEWRVVVTHDAEACRQADVVVVDHARGLQRAASHAALGRARPRLLVITAEQREHEVRRALEAGVHGYLLSDCERDELAHCVRTLSGGARYFSLAAAQAMADSLSREALTTRELEVLALLMRGQSNKIIARSLGIALGTVKAHVRALMAKLGARCRTEVVAVAASRGLGSVPQPPSLPAPPAMARWATGRPALHEALAA